MSAREKSDLPEVAEKRANKVASAAAELVERRGGAKENAELQSMVRTQSREAVSQAQARIRDDRDGFQGIIAIGDPSAIVRHPRVVEAYMGNADLGLPNIGPTGAGDGAA